MSCWEFPSCALWIYESRPNNWRSYDSASYRLLESSFNDGDEVVRISPHGRNFNVHLQRWIQISATTNSERRVKRVESVNARFLREEEEREVAAVDVVWSWQCGGGYTNFDRRTTKLLESAFSLGHRSVCLFGNICDWTSNSPKGYSMDLSNMTQLNLSSGRIRKIQRVESENVRHRRAEAASTDIRSCVRDIKEEDEDIAEGSQCSICFQELSKDEEENSKQAVKFEECQGHGYHRECMELIIGNALNKGQKFVKCPYCQHTYGVETGDQPLDGHMGVNERRNIFCSGFEGNSDGAYVISYNFPSGRRDGKSYDGTSRTAYLPMNPEGLLIRRLLEVAFSRRLVFTVDESHTTKRYAVTWSIHHKTSLNGGSHGYPDGGYLGRVKEELAARGVTENDLE